MKLDEGEVYPFQVLKLVSIPEEGDFFQLRHASSGRRLLISANRYKNYGIEPGTIIECKVNKVSCTGKVYLEPKHPFYVEGNIYSFDIVDITKSEKHSDMLRIAVKDLFSNTIEVCCAKNKLISSKKIDLKVEFVFKGIPSLTSKLN